MSSEALAEEWERLHLSVTPAMTLTEVRKVSARLDAIWIEAASLDQGQVRLLEVLDRLTKRGRKARGKTG